MHRAFRTSPPPLGHFLRTSPQQLENRASATTLSAIEIEVFPDLVQAQILANLMSPSLWGWRDRVPKRSGSPVRRKVEGIKQFIIANYEFTHFRGRPGLDLFGTTTIEAEKERFAPTAKTEWVFQNLQELFGEGKTTPLSELLGVKDIRDHYGLTDLPPGTIPVWGNEILDKMDAYRAFSPDNIGSGKCEALAALYAAALIAVGGFPVSEVFMLFTPTHVMTCLMQGGGFVSSNKRMFSAVSLSNQTAHTRVVRSCFEEAEITRLQSCGGLVDIRESEMSLSRETLFEFYRKLEKYARTAGCRPPTLPSLEGKERVPPLPMPDGLQGARQWQDHVVELADRLPGSAFDLARYAFRMVEVEHPEAYAHAARYRCPHTRLLATRLRTVAACSDFSRRGVAQGEELFGSARLAMPDETVTLGSGGHRDRALLLYAMLGHLGEEPQVVFAEASSHVLNGGELISLAGYDPDEKVRSLFDSTGHWDFSGQGPTLREIIQGLSS